MSFEFTMVLSREITDGEVDILRKSGCGDAAVTTATVGAEGNEVVVTRMDFQTDAPSLEEALTSAIEAVKAVPDLTAASVSVPAYGGADPTEFESTSQEKEEIQAQSERVPTESETAAPEEDAAPDMGEAASGQGNANPAHGDAVPTKSRKSSRSSRARRT
jgi:hypothetical protein